LNVNDLTPTEIAIVSMLRASDADGKEYSSIPGRIHLVKELFAFSSTSLGRVLLEELRFEPDNFGPYDETIIAALDELHDAGFIEYEPHRDYSKIGLTKDGRRLADNVWARLRDEVRRLIVYTKMNYNDLTSEQVLDQIYSLYPQMARYSLSKVAKKYRRPEL